MEGFIFADLTYDQWMNIAAGSGIIVLFLSFWLQNLFPKMSYWPLYLGKIIGFGLIALPLFSRWYFSESLLLMSSISMMLISIYFLFLNRYRT